MREDALLALAQLVKRIGYEDVNRSGGRFNYSGRGEGDRKLGAMRGGARRAIPHDLGVVHMRDILDLFKAATADVHRRMDLLIEELEQLPPEERTAKAAEYERRYVALLDEHAQLGKNLISANNLFDAGSSSKASH